MNILLTLSYDGTRYCGWQIQQNGDTVQARLEHALTAVYKTNITVLGASRTDAGVHAIGQCAHFHVGDAALGVPFMDNDVRIVPNIPLDKLPQVINKHLPSDIVVTYAEQTADDFHPIACAKRKTYEYRILNQKYADPKLVNYAAYVYLPLDFEKMRQAAGHFVGTHDFAAFSSTGGKVKTSVRTIYDVKLIKQNNEILFYVTGNGFLYNMVRIIAGTLVEVGSDKINPDGIPSIIQSKDRKKAGRTAPSCGLTLLEVEY